jgi:hypothetical protein
MAPDAKTNVEARVHVKSYFAMGEIEATRTYSAFLKKHLVSGTVLQAETDHFGKPNKQTNVFLNLQWDVLRVPKFCS